MQIYSSSLARCAVAVPLEFLTYGVFAEVDPVGRRDWLACLGPYSLRSGTILPTQRLRTRRAECPWSSSFTELPYKYISTEGI